MVSHDRRVLALALAGGAPAVVLATFYLRALPWPVPARVAAWLAVVAIWAGLAMLARRRQT